jgi:hypothetical protein
VKIGQKAVQENPFYGRTKLLSLSESVKKKAVTKGMLDDAYFSVKTDEDKKLFHVINFSGGDIANRQHYIFNQDKIDKGGEASNEQWIIYLEWLLEKDPKQFIKFMPLMVEFVGLRELTTSQIRTIKPTNKVAGSWGLLAKIQEKEVVYKAFIDLLASYYNGKPYQKWLLAKHLARPSLSKRQKVERKTGIKKGTRDLQAITVKSEVSKIRLFNDLSEKLGLEVIQYPKNKSFVGLNKFRAEHNQNLESVLFSTKSIMDFDKEQFFAWLNNVPSGARFNVRRRLLTGDDKPKEKWDKRLATWYLEWENYKEDKQQEQRELQVKVDKGEATKVDIEKLAEVKKEAKVTTGAKTLFEYLKDFLSSMSNGSGNIDSLTIQSIIDKTIFNVPALIAIDNSMSMTQNQGTLINTAYLLATLALLKNPNLEMADMIIRFGSKSSLITAGSTASVNGGNRFMAGSSVRVEKLVDRTRPFNENFNNVARLLPADMGSTNFSGIPELFHKWVNEVPDLIAYRKEQVSQFPVMLILTDGDFNNQPSPSQSLLDFQMKMRQWFSAEPVIVIWDVSGTTQTWGRFNSIENVITFSGFNISNVNQIFTKLHDLDVIDTYTSLKSLYMSNRYDLVKEATLK